MFKMKQLKKKPLARSLAIIAIVSLFALLIGCSPSSDLDDKQSQFTKEKIMEALTSSEAEIFQITWSPDEKNVVYIQQGDAENEGLDEAYIWKVGEEQPHFVKKVKPTVHGFSWSPDNKYFLISEKLGEGAESTIFNASTLQQEAFKPQSISIPVWSPDSTALAYGKEENHYGQSWGFLEIYTLGDNESEYLWRAKDYIYKVEAWQEDGNIIYTELDPQGKENKKAAKNIRPSISGVHLKDSKEQVKMALGENYKETPPNEEPGHFPEQVYRWDYDNCTIYIGAESGEVLAIFTEHPNAETNLGIKVGDTAEKVFATYRPQYMEPESIHGGKLYGIFNVEGAAAMFFDFDLSEFATREDIKPENKVTRIILTYPEIMDDSF